MAHSTPYQPKSLPFNEIDWAHHLPLISKATSAIARFDGWLQSIPNPGLLLTPAMTQEAVLSSRIEGTRATIEEVLEYDAEPTGEARNIHDIQEVDNYRKALEFATSQLNGSPLTLNLICNMHAILLNGVRGHNKRRGEFRRDQNWIGRPGASLKEASFVPPSPIDLPHHLSNFERYLHVEDRDRLVQLAIIHAQFELLHPFLDGNGRIGRILIPLFLYEKKVISQPCFYASAYFEKWQDVYYDKLQAISKEGGWVGWIDFFLTAVTVQAEAHTKQMQKIQSLYEQMKEQLVTIVRSPLIIQVIDYMFTKPIFKGSHFTQTIDAAKTTSTRWLTQLVEKNILSLTRETRGRGGNIYRFNALVDLLGN